MARKSLTELREEMRAVARGERKASSLPAAPSARCFISRSSRTSGRSAAQAPGERERAGGTDRPGSAEHFPLLAAPCQIPPDPACAARTRSTGRAYREGRKGGSRNGDIRDGSSGLTIVPSTRESVVTLRRDGSGPDGLLAILPYSDPKSL